MNSPVWVAVTLPNLALESWLLARLGATGPQPEPAADRPHALLQQHRITAVDEAARALGVIPGQKRATALALAPGLQLLPVDRERQTRALRSAAWAAQAYTPQVCFWGERTILLEVSASLRLFGGLPQLLAGLLQDVQALGHQAVLGVAATPLAAAWRAGFRADQPEGGETLETGWQALESTQIAMAATREALAGLPVAVLRWGGSAAVWTDQPATPTPWPWAELQSMGLHRLGDVRRLPREGFNRRWGPEALRDLDRAWGDQTHTLPALATDEPFSQGLELMARADNAAQLLHAAERLLMSLLAWARARQVRVVRWTLRLQHERRSRREDEPTHTDVAIALAEPSNEAEHLSLLLRERLQRWVLPAPVVALRLQADEVTATPTPSGDLFPTRAPGQAGLARLLDRLQARLGPDRVQRWQPHPDHRPEHGTQLRPWVSAPSPSSPQKARSGQAELEGPKPPARLSRPPWLLCQPQALKEQQHRPCLEGHPLQLISGPERIEAGWWDEVKTEEGASPLAARDYFIARTHEGALVWIYRHRFPHDPEAQGWFLQGRFA